MATGFINMQLETPDINLIGDGTFDVSAYFTEMFTSNSTIKESLAAKVKDIFDRIDPTHISSEWSQKIMDSLQIERANITFEKPALAKLKESVPQLPKVKDSQTESKDVKNIATSLSTSIFDTISKAPFFKNLLPDINQPSTDSTESTEQDQKINEIYKSIPSLLNLQKLHESSPEEDTVFEELPSMIIDSFSDEALKQLTKLFMGDTSAYYKPDDEEEYSAKRGWLSKLFDGDLTPLITSAIGGGLGAMVPAALQGLAGGALLVGSLVWLATDAIRGWLSAEKWGVSKGSALVGGLLGGTEEGLKGALVNAGKGATIGMTIGMGVGGPVGIVFGGLIGAAVGGLLGWFGGEKIAKALDAAHDELTQWWNGETMRLVKQSLGIVLPDLQPSSEDIAFHAEQRNKLRNLGYNIQDDQQSMPSKQYDEIMNRLEQDPQKNFWLINEMFKIKRDETDRYTTLINDQSKLLTHLDSLLEPLLKEDQQLISLLKNQQLTDPSISLSNIANYLELHRYSRGTSEFNRAMSYILEERSKRMADNDVEEFRFDIPPENEGVSDNSQPETRVPDKQTEQSWLIRFLDRLPKADQAPPEMWQMRDGLLDFQQLKIIPDKNDQYYPMKDSGLLAKDGGTIDKKLDKVSANINTLIKAVEDKLNSVVTELNGHAKILQNIADMSNLQYEFMPALVPASPAPPPTPSPITDTRDAIFEYRGKVYERGRIHGY